MGKLIAVEGMTLTFTPVTVTGVITITGSASVKSKVKGMGVYKDQLSLSISGASDSSTMMVATSVGTGNISSTALKVKADGSLVLLNGDMTSTITIPAVHSSSGVAGSVIFTLTISDAGQTFVKGI